MKIAITGHRPDKLDNDYDLKSLLTSEIKLKIIEVIDEKIMQFPNELVLISGMALGIDTLFAKIAIELNLPFIAALPCVGQQSRWPEKSRKQYFEILQNELCEIHYVSNSGYTNFCMQKRNEWMVNECNILIAVWDGSSGGTSNCIKYAKKVNREIIIINPDDFRR